MKTKRCHICIDDIKYICRLKNANICTTCDAYICRMCMNELIIKYDKNRCSICKSVIICESNVDICESNVDISSKFQQYSVKCQNFCHDVNIGRDIISEYLYKYSYKLKPIVSFLLVYILLFSLGFTISSISLYFTTDNTVMEVPVVILDNIFCLLWIPYIGLLSVIVVIMILGIFLNILSCIKKMDCDIII